MNVCDLQGLLKTTQDCHACARGDGDVLRRSQFHNRGLFFFVENLLSRRQNSASADSSGVAAAASLKRQRYKNIVTACAPPASCQSSASLEIWMQFWKRLCRTHILSKRMHISGIKVAARTERQGAQLDLYQLRLSEAESVSWMSAAPCVTLIASSENILPHWAPECLPTPRYVYYCL